MSQERNLDDPQYKTWRAAVFARDKGICRICGRKGEEIHHILSWAKEPDRRYDVNNGITLCKTCHEKTGSYYKPIKYTQQARTTRYNKRVPPIEFPDSTERYSLGNKLALLKAVYWACAILFASIVISTFVFKIYWSLIIGVLLIWVEILLDREAKKVDSTINAIDAITHNRNEIKNCLLHLGQTTPLYTEYKNDYDGYSINYPVDWQVDEDDLHIYIYPSPEIYGFWILGHLSIDVDFLIDGQTLEEWVNNDIEFTRESSIRGGEYYKLCENKKLTGTRLQWYVSCEEKGFVDYINYNERFYAQNGERIYIIEAHGVKDYYHVYPFRDMIPSFKLLQNSGF